MIRCRGSGPGGSVKSAPALPRPRPLLPRLRVDARVLRHRRPKRLLPPPPLRRTPSPSRKLVPRPFAAVRRPTSRRNRRSMTPPLRLRPRLPQPLRRCTLPRSRLLHHLRRLRPSRLRPSRSPSRCRRPVTVTRPPLLSPRSRRNQPRRPVRRRLRAHRRRSPCRRPTRAPRRARTARRIRTAPHTARPERPRDHRVRRCVPRRPGCRIGRVRPAQGCRRARALVRVAGISAGHARSPQPRRRSVGRQSARPAVVHRVQVVEPRVQALRRALAGTRVVVVARRASEGRSIRPPSTPTSRRR